MRRYFFSVKMFKKSWYKGNNGNLLTIEPSMAALISRRGRSVSSGCGYWSWINGRGIQGLMGRCCGLAESGILAMSEVAERYEKIENWVRVPKQKIIKDYQI